MDANSSIPKLLVSLCNDDLKQQVHFLGQHASMTLHVGDVVAMSGVRVSEWRNERSLETTFLTIVEVNPKERDDIFDVPQINNEQRKRKALCLTQQNVLRVADVKGLMAELLEKAPTNDQKEFMIVGHLSVLTHEFFEQDAPIVSGARQEKMCWTTAVEDSTGCLPVKVWGRACFELFHVTASKLRELWEEGNEHEERRDDILSSLNGELHHEVRATCSARVWSHGSRMEKHVVQVNVNAAETVPE